MIKIHLPFNRYTLLILTKNKISKSLEGNQRAKGFKHSDETRKKVSKGGRERYKNTPMTEEHKKRIADSNRLVKSTIEAKDKLSKRMKEYCKNNPEKIEKRIKELAELNKNNSRPIFQYNKQDVLIKKFNSIREASEETNNISSNIYRCANGIRKTCGGFKWLWG